MSNLKKKIVLNQITICSILLFIVLTTMTIGFAAYNKIVTITNRVTIKAQTGTLEITSITYSNGAQVQSHTENKTASLTASFQTNFRGNNNKNVVHQIVITNNTNQNYVYNNNTYNQNVTADRGTGTLAATVAGINNGDVLKPGESVTLTVTQTLTATGGRNNTNYTTTSDITFNFEVDPTGTITASINTSSINFANESSIEKVAIRVINTYSYYKTINVSTTNSSFKIVDAGGNEITSFNVTPNSDAIHEIFIKIAPGVEFADSPEIISLQMTNELTLVGSGQISAFVPSAGDIDDTLAPQIGNVSLTRSNTVGTINVSFSRTDTGGSAINKYVAMLYDSNGNLKKTVDVNPTSNSATFTNQPDGNYYAIVYGIDNAGNTGYTDIANASETNPNCRKSPMTNISWTYNITNNLTNMTSNGAATVTLGNTYSATLSANTNYTLPATITITMNGTNLQAGTDYTYNQTSGSLSIPNVSGNISITGTAVENDPGTCLAEGTLITLANGQTKKIEDIKYDDLLLVYNHETGTFVYEYPIWIEKIHSYNEYTEVIFEDNSSLKIVGDHSIYSYDLKRFISIKDELKTNMKVARYNGKKFKQVKVKSINTINQQVFYYNVISNRYLNIIANNYLTVSWPLMIANVYDFDKDIKWIDYDKYRNRLTYQDLPNTPIYLFYGLRFEDVPIFLERNKIAINDLDYIISKYLVNDFYQEKINIKDNKNYWYVKVSNNEPLLLEENTYYTLPNTKGLWYNHADNKTYLPYSKILVSNSMYLEAIKNVKKKK